MLQTTLKGMAMNLRYFLGTVPINTWRHLWERELLAELLARFYFRTTSANGVITIKSTGNAGGYGTIKISTSRLEELITLINGKVIDEHRDRVVERPMLSFIPPFCDKPAILVVRGSDVYLEMISMGMGYLYLGNVHFFREQRAALIAVCEHLLRNEKRQKKTPLKAPLVGHV